MAEKIGRSRFVSDVGKPHVKPTKEDMSPFLQNTVGKWFHIPPAMVKDENYLQKEIAKRRGESI